MSSFRLADAIDGLFVSDRSRDRAPPARLVRGLGVVALVAIGCCAVWIAVGAADGRFWLELPTSANPRWIDGPLQALTSIVGSLPPSALSTALIAMAVAYLAALTCAGSIPFPAAIGAVALANLAFTLGPTLLSTDVFGYIAYAREAAHGLNPYLTPPSGLPHDAVIQFIYWKHATSPYGALFTGLSAPLGFVSAGAALWIFKAVAGLAAVAITMLVAQIARARGLNPTRAAIFVGLNPVLLFYAVSGAHNDLLGALLVVGAIALVLKGRDGAGAGVAVAAAAIKVTLGLALPFIVLGARRRGSAVRGAALAIVVIGVATLALFGTHLFDQLHRITTDPRFDIASSGPDRLATALGTQIGSVVRAACAGAAATAALLALVWARRGRGDWIAAAGWAFLALIASIASLAPWYVVWLVPFAAVARSRALRVATILLTGYLLAVHLPAFGNEPWLSGPVRGPAREIVFRRPQRATSEGSRCTSAAFVTGRGTEAGASRYSVGDLLLGRAITMLRSGTVLFCLIRSARAARPNSRDATSCAC